MVKTCGEIRGYISSIGDFLRAKTADPWEEKKAYSMKTLGYNAVPPP